MVTKEQTDKYVNYGILAAIGIVAYFVYKLVTSFDVGTTFKIGVDLQPSLAFLVAAIVAIIVYIYIGKHLSDTNENTRNLVSIIGAVIGFAFTYYYWYVGLIIGILLIAYTVVKRKYL